MNALKTMIGATVLAGLSASGATTSNAEGHAPALSMRPLYAVSFDVGRKHAVSYFLSENGQCKLTLVVADVLDGDTLPTDTPIRFDAAIDAGKDARFDTAEGKSLHFACAQSSQAMLVREVPQVAYSAPAK